MADFHLLIFVWQICSRLKDCHNHLSCCCERLLISGPWTAAHRKPTVCVSTLTKHCMDHTALASVLTTLTFRELLKAYQCYYPNISSHVVLFPLNESISITWDWWCLVSHEYCFSQMTGPVAIFLFTHVGLQLKRYSLIYLYFSKAS